MATSFYNTLLVVLATTFAVKCFTAKNTTTNSNSNDIITIIIMAIKMMMLNNKNVSNRKKFTRSTDTFSCHEFGVSFCRLHNLTV